MEESLERHSQLWLVVLCAAAFLLTYLAPVDASFSDPWGTLLTAQAIVEHGSIRLDPYVGDERYPYQVLTPQANGHVYDYFPLGTSLAAVPAVALARLRGEDMIYPEDNRALQNTLSSLLVVACTLLIFALCRQELEAPAAFAWTAVFVFGSPIASTLGTALWSSGLALVLGLATLLLLARSEGRFDAGPPAWGLGVLTFAAFLCRPTLAWLVALVAAYLAYRRRRPPIVYAATVAIGFGLFVLFSRLEYSLLLPPYYLPSRLGGDGSFAVALWGHLLSPSRGILVGSPFLLLVAAGALIRARRLLREPLAWLAVAWILLHWLTISSFYHWWGGWSFGSRLFLDALPAFVVLAVKVTAAAREQWTGRVRAPAAALLLAAAAFSVFVHTHQGLYNVYTVLWNDGIDRDPSRVFDWRRPQFLATPRTLGIHPREHALLAAPPHPLGASITPTSDRVVFEGWSVPEGGGAWRWSSSTTPRILFLAPEEMAQAEEMILSIEAGTYQPQVVGVRLNGVALGELRSDRNWEPATWELPVPQQALASARQPLPGARIFVLELDVPGAVMVGEGAEARRLGVCLRRVTLRPGA